MKANDIRKMSVEQINTKIADLKEELFNLKFQAALGNLEKPARMNEIKRTIEEVVRVEYIAEDGTVFNSEAECRTYEESALFVVSSKLKKLTHKFTSEYDFIEAGSDENELEIFDVQTQEDLDNLKRYLYLKAIKNGATDKDIQGCFTSVDGQRNNLVFDNVTYGHEVMVFWSYDSNWFWVYGDGSVDGYCKWVKERYTQMITLKGKDNK
jgi:large subunit ribosomal protein L29